MQSSNSSNYFPSDGKNQRREEIFVSWNIKFSVQANFALRLKVRLCEERREL